MSVFGCCGPTAALTKSDYEIAHTDTGNQSESTMSDSVSPPPIRQVKTTSSKILPDPLNDTVQGQMTSNSGNIKASGKSLERVQTRSNRLQKSQTSDSARTVVVVAPLSKRNWLDQSNRTTLVANKSTPMASMYTPSSDADMPMPLDSALIGQDNKRTLVMPAQQVFDNKLALVNNNNTQSDQSQSNKKTLVNPSNLAGSGKLRTDSNRTITAPKISIIDALSRTLTGNHYTSTPEEKARSRQINKFLKKEAAIYTSLKSKLITTALLGIAEAGKSTVIKEMEMHWV